MPGMPAARIMDPVVHPLPGMLLPGPGSMNVLIGYKPAWRGIPLAAAAGLQAAKAVSDSVVQAAEAATIAAAGTPGAPAAKAAEEATKAAALAAMSSMINSLAAASATPSGGMPDIHACLTPLPPHGPGLVIDGSPTVLINGLPACVVGDTILEALGPPNKIIMGQMNVLIGDGGAGGMGGPGSMLAGVAAMMAKAVQIALDRAGQAMSLVADAARFMLAVAQNTIVAVLEAVRGVTNALIDAALRGIQAFAQAAAAAFNAAAKAMRTSRVKGMDADAADAAIEKAQKNAVAALDKRIKDLDAWDEDTKKSFETWFGSSDEAARTEIRDRMVKSKEKLESFTLDNYAPDDDAYAYVYPDKDDKMYLGEQFATAPETGRDSQAGTLVHEVSHYDSVGATDDVEHDGQTVYGESGAKKLAKDDPAKARKNADNYEYFLEDGM